MKTILRNLISVLRRFKMATILNLIGLAIAFAVFTVILIQVRNEYSFDTCHSTSKRVFRVDLQEEGTFSTILPRGFVEEVIHSSPHIEAATLINPFIGPIYFSFQEGNEKHGFIESIQTCHPDITKVFDFPIVEGDPGCLNDPDKMIIPQSMAKKMFGDQSAVGKVLQVEENIWSKNRDKLTVGAVYKDFPENTQLRNVIFTAIDADFMLSNFFASNFICYLLIDKESNVDDVASNFNKNFDFAKIDKPDEKIKLTKLTDIYFLNETPDGRIFRSGNSDVPKLLLFVALLILIVAVINYTNFSTSLAPARMKSINTQKVLGSSDSLLRRALLFEAVLISMIAWIFSLFIIWVLEKSALISIISPNLDISSNTFALILSGLIAMVSGLIAGLYPSWYIVSFQPALVLKGSFGLSPSGRKLRTALIGFQFVVSIMLIIGAGFVRLQNNFMRSYSLGFDKEQIAVVKLSGDIYDKHRETYINRLKEYSGIEDVAFAMEKMASQDVYSTNGGKYKEKQFQYFMIAVSPNFLRVMGIPVVEGRDFSKSDELSEERSLIFNKATRLSLDMEAGDYIDSWGPGRIIGFTDDLKFTSLRQNEDNIAFVTTNSHSLPYSYIRVGAGADPHQAVSHIRKTLSDIDPAYPFDVEFYDSIFDQFYKKEVNLRSLITLFSILAIIISLVGVFGLVVFDTQYKRKEIAIRKVHGSTIQEILGMLNKQYIYIVTFCFVIAAPMAFYGVKKWLESFAYKTPIYWWVYLIAFLIVLLITIATVTFQSFRAATVNPIDSIKSE